MDGDEKGWFSELSNISLRESTTWFDRPEIYIPSSLSLFQHYFSFSTPSVFFLYLFFSTPPSSSIDSLPKSSPYPLRQKRRERERERESTIRFVLNRTSREPWKRIHSSLPPQLSMKRCEIEREREQGEGEKREWKRRQIVMERKASRTRWLTTLSSKDWTEKIELDMDSQG